MGTPSHTTERTHANNRQDPTGGQTEMLHKDQINKFDYHYDRGHGWLEVPAWMIERMGLSEVISKYSYVRDGKVYLEEDIDAGTLLHALDKGGYPFEIREIDDGSDSEIRTYRRYSQ